jgi:hypothetical protein
MMKKVNWYSSARVKAIESGNLGCLKISTYEEYFHSFVKPEPNDVILDGGVSESVNSQIEFIKHIGPEGKYFGFEPDPIGFCKERGNIIKSACYDNYELIPFGLWHKRDKFLFEISGQGKIQLVVNYL